MIKGIYHVAIAVKNIEETMDLYCKAFDLKKVPIDTLPEHGVKSAMIKIGNSNIELISPLDANGGVAKFIEAKGEGIHHVSFEVDNVDTELNALAAKGVALIDKKARPSGTGGMMGFVHPKSTKGVLVELSKP